MHVMKTFFFGIALVFASAIAAPNSRWRNFGDSDNNGRNSFDSIFSSANSGFDGNWGSAFSGSDGSSGGGRGVTLGSGGANKGASSFDLNSFSNKGGNSKSNFGGFSSSNWGRGDQVSTGGAVSSKAVGPNSRSLTSSSSHFDLTNGASSQGTSFRSGNFGESQINLDLFQSRGNSYSRSSGGRVDAKSRPSENSFGFGGAGAGLNFGSSVGTQDRGSGQGRVSGSVSAAGSHLTKSNQ